MAVGQRVAAVGGGHGLAVSLSALRLLGIEPTAIVTMADDGGSSGRLRRGLGMLPPGDVRMAMLALASPPDPNARTLADLFAYRFAAGDLDGHSLGNLVLTALTDLEGGFLDAIRTASRLLGVRGRVLPSTLAQVELCGTVDGTVIRGQANLGRVTGAIERVWLDPADPPALPEAVAAIREADLILLGPGSTFTSVAPNLLVPELGRTLAEAADRVVYVCNLEPGMGETAGFTPADHLAAMLDHCPGLRIPRMICQRPADPTAAAAEAATLGDLGAEVIHADVAADGRRGHHDPARLAATLETLV